MQALMLQSVVAEDDSCLRVVLQEAVRSLLPARGYIDRCPRSPLDERGLIAGLSRRVFGAHLPAARGVAAIPTGNHPCCDTPRLQMLDQCYDHGRLSGSAGDDVSHDDDLGSGAHDRPPPPAKRLTQNEQPLIHQRQRPKQHGQGASAQPGVNQGLLHPGAPTTA